MMKWPLRIITLICVLGLLAGCTALRFPGRLSGKSGPASDSGSEIGQEFQAPLFPDTEPAVLWGREQLDDHAKAAYDKMSQAIACYRESPLDVEADSEEIELVLLAIRMDHPEYFWFDGEATFVSTELAGVTVSTACTFVYTLDRDEIQKMGQQVQQFTAACLTSPELAAAESDYEKILGVYRYIIDNTDYVTADADQSIMSVMAEHQGACAGYARSFQYIMSQLDIPCTLALGTGDSGESHGWNMVQCEGEWYQVDVTWGDPVTPEGAPGDSLQYTYCLVTDAEIYRDHTLDQTIPMPVCTETKWNYFRQEGLQFDTWDEEAFEAVLSAAVEQGESQLNVRFSEEEAYQAARKTLFEESLIMDMLMQKGVIEATGQQYVTYTQNDTFFEITVRLR